MLVKYTIQCYFLHISRFISYFLFYESGSYEYANPCEIEDICVKLLYSMIIIIIITIIIIIIIIKFKKIKLNL